MLLELQIYKKLSGVSRLTHRGPRRRVKTSRTVKTSLEFAFVEDPLGFFAPKIGAPLPLLISIELATAPDGG